MEANNIINALKHLSEGRTIIDIKKLERELAEKMPGIDNHEPWRAGSKQGQSLSPEAEARLKIFS